MQVSVEKIGSLGRKINVAIPATKINETISNKLKKLTKQVKLNGFRPGHVPLKLVNEKYGSSVRQEVINEAINEAIHQAMAEHELSPLGDIKLENVTDELDKDLECTFFLEVYPEVEFNEFSELQIKTPKVTITEADLEKSLSIVREQFSKKVSVERAAQKGDLLTVDYHGLVDGKEFSGGSAKDSQVEIGSDAFIEGFETGLIGAIAGTSVELNLQFPVEYAEQSLAGKSVVFKVDIKTIEEKQLAEINEELAKSLQIKDGDVTKIRPTIAANMEKYLQKLVMERELEQTVDALLIAYPIELPNQLVESEQKQLEATFKQRNQEQGIMINEISNHVITKLNLQARKNVHLSLLLRNIIQKNNIKIDDNVVRQKLKEFEVLFQNNPPTQQLKQLYANIKNSIINSTLTNMAIEFVAKRVTKLEETVSFDELIKTNNT